MEKPKDIQLLETLKKTVKLMPKKRKPDMGLMIERFAKVDWMWSYFNAVLDTAVARKEMKESERSYTIEELKEELGLNKT